MKWLTTVRWSHCSECGNEIARGETILIDDRRVFCAPCGKKRQPPLRPTALRRDAYAHGMATREKAE